MRGLGRGCLHEPAPLCVLHPGVVTIDGVVFGPRAPPDATLQWAVDPSVDVDGALTAAISVGNPKFMLAYLPGGLLPQGTRSVHHAARARSCPPGAFAQVPTSLNSSRLFLVPLCFPPQHVVSITPFPPLLVTYPAHVHAGIPPSAHPHAPPHPPTTRCPFHHRHLFSLQNTLAFFP